MEKTKNGWYKTVSILLYIFASLMAVGLIVIVIYGLTSAEKVAAVLNEMVEPDENGIMELYTAESVKSAILSLTLFSVPSIAFMYIEAVKFDKFTFMTDAEAAANYKNCIIWIIALFFFGGTLLGILAIIGLLSVQAKQKERFLLSGVMNAEAGKETENLAEDTIFVKTEENTETANVKSKEDKTAERLAKLESLKQSGALSDEEYNDLKNKIMK